MIYFSRKRCRNIHDDDTSEFMPLSKRINNLHINNALQVINNTSEPVNMYLKPNEWGPGPPGYSESSLPHSQETYNPETPENDQVSGSGWNTEAPQYTPELDETQNPYYYNNKLLFDLFVERMQRNGHNFQ